MEIGTIYGGVATLLSGYLLTLRIREMTRERPDPKLTYVRNEEMLRMREGLEGFQREHKGDIEHLRTEHRGDFVRFEHRMTKDVRKLEALISKNAQQIAALTAQMNLLIGSKR